MFGGVKASSALSPAMLGNRAGSLAHALSLAPAILPRPGSLPIGPGDVLPNGMARPAWVGRVNAVDSLGWARGNAANPEMLNGYEQGDQSFPEAGPNG